MSEHRIALVKEMFNASVSELTNAQSAFNLLDTKAQNTTTIAGIFLAGILTLLNNTKLAGVIFSYDLLLLILLGASILFLILTVIFCLSSIIIRKTPILRLETFQTELNEVLNQPEDQMEQRYENFLLARINDWLAAASQLRTTNVNKADKILYGQICLMLSIISIAALMIYVFISNYFSNNGS